MKNEELILEFLRRIESQSDKLTDKLDIVEDKCSELDKEYRIQKLETNTRLDKYNKELEIHVEGVNQCRVGITHNDERIDSLTTIVETLTTKLDTPSDTKTTFKTLRKWLIGAACIATALMTIWKFVDIIKKEILSKMI